VLRAPPDIVEAILGGRADQRVMLERLERPLLVGWEDQRRVLLHGGLVRVADLPVVPTSSAVPPPSRAEAATPGPHACRRSALHG
jgi:hypothetical protein